MGEAGRSEGGRLLIYEHMMGWPPTIHSARVGVPDRPFRAKPDIHLVRTPGEVSYAHPGTKPGPGGNPECAAEGIEP